MCRILVIPHIPKGKQQEVFKFMKAATPAMSEHNSDGIGYAAMKTNGSLFGERWLNNEQAWKFRQENFVDQKVKAIRDKLLKKFDGKLTFPEPPQLYNKFGTFLEKDNIISAFLHTRFATCSKSLINTHPFYRPQSKHKLEIHNDEIALIHNGVIRNDEQWKDQRISTNDSEAILCAYLNNYVQYAPEEMTTMLEELVGYYAFSVMTKDKNDVPIVDVVRGNKADLFVAYIDELETEVFCTRDELLEITCKKLKWTISAMSEIKAGSYFRFNALTGEITHNESFTPGYEWSQHNTKHFDQGWSTYNKETSLEVVKPSAEAFKSAPVSDSVAKVLAAVNAKGLTDADKDQLEMAAIEHMTDEEFGDYYEMKAKFSAENFTSDDPIEVSNYLKTMKH